MKYKKISSYEQINNIISELNNNKTKYKQDLQDGHTVEWLEHIFDDVSQFENITPKYRALKNHRIEPLVELASNITNTLSKTTMSMVKKSAPYCIKWNEQWRYGKTYLLDCMFISEINEEITEEKAFEFLSQVKWLIEQIKADTSDLRINIDDIERSVKI